MNVEVVTTSKNVAKVCEDHGFRCELVDGRPLTVIKIDGVEVIRYLGDVKLDSFLKTLKILREAKQNGNLSAEIKVFVSPFCPHCAKVIENVNSLAVENPNVKVEIIDVSVYPELAEKYGITSAPTTIINDSVRLIGYISKEEVVKWIEKAEDKKEYFVKLIKDGRLDELLDSIKDENNLGVVVDLLAYNDFMVRLGAMVVLEEVFKSNPSIVKAVKDKIRKLLKHDDKRIVQDVAMLLGVIGDEEDIEFLKDLVKAGGEVKLSAEEAIEEIAKRFRK
jgi:thiol-disulfide isomerase/thioredoxin